MPAVLIAWLARFVGERAAALAGRVLLLLLAAAAVLAPLWLAYRHGVSVTTARYEQRLAEADLEAAQRRVQAVQAARDEERDAATTSIAATEARMKAEQEENDALSRDITALKSGDLRVRGRLAAGRCSALDVRADAADPGRAVAARTGGLQPADAEFLLRVGREADTVARKLSDAQAQLRICQALNNGPSSP